MEDSIFIETDKAQELLDEGLCYFIDSSMVANAKENHFSLRIRSSLFFSISEIKDINSPLSNALPTASAFTEFMIKLGVPNDGKKVIVYDQTGLGYAPRGYFMLKYYGYPQVFILNGGLVKWLKEERPTDSGIYPIWKDNNTESLDHYQFVENKDMVVLYEEIVSLLSSIENGDNSCMLWDPRPSNVFEAGHVPHAINIPELSFLTEEKTVKPREEIIKILGDHGICSDNRVVGTCLKGNTSCVAYVILKHIGNHNVRMYGGSYEEWKQKEPKHAELAN